MSEHSIEEKLGELTTKKDMLQLMEKKYYDSTYPLNMIHLPLKFFEKEEWITKTIKNNIENSFLNTLESKKRNPTVSEEEFRRYIIYELNHELENYQTKLKTFIWSINIEIITPEFISNLLTEETTKKTNNIINWQEEN